ncbi:MAG: hypothetical protein IJV83_00355 [Clostridia bacterium]|nr:hypothetical protein [Clostridia bacterium]
MKKQKNPPTQKRKWWFRFMKKLMKGRYKRPTFVYMGEKFSNGAVVLSNHEGTDAPLSLEMYCDKPVRMWGAWEMNSGVIQMYKYQSRVYYHEKKHWNLFLARLFCLIASPLTNLFYKGLNLISTYRDARFMKTLRQSVEAIQNGENIVIFPEDSTKGYLEQLEDFHHGFLALCEYCAKKGIDVPIYVTYFRKKDLTYFVDNPILYSELKKTESTKEAMAKRLLDRCNELGQMQVERPEGATELFLGQQAIAEVAAADA